MSIFKTFILKVKRDFQGIFNDISIKNLAIRIFNLLYSLTLVLICFALIPLLFYLIVITLTSILDKNFEMEVGINSNLLIIVITFITPIIFSKKSLSANAEIAYNKFYLHIKNDILLKICKSEEYIKNNFDDILPYVSVFIFDRYCFLINNINKQFENNSQKKLDNILACLSLMNEINSILGTNFKETTHQLKDILLINGFTKEEIAEIIKLK